MQIILTGSPGCGKSRLIASLMSAVEAVTGSVQHCRCSSLNFKGRGIKEIFLYRIVIIEGIGSAKDLPKNIPETSLIKHPYEKVAREHLRPIVIVETNLEASAFAKTTGWTVIDMDKMPLYAFQELSRVISDRMNMSETF